jgi:excisionase family DNA binding protein
MREDQGRTAPLGESDWLTLGRAARYLGVAQSTIRKWSDSGRLRAFKTPGGHRRYRRADLDDFLEGSAPESRSGPVVLIVDDDERLREYVRVNLEMEGYTIHEAASADDGMRVLDELRPDLVLLDVMMPSVDGWEMLRLMHERHGVGSIPVVMFSGKVDPRAADQAAERGVQGFIGKPFDPNELIAQTKQLLPT